MKILKGLLIFPFALTFLTIAFIILAIQISINSIYDEDIIGNILDDYKNK